MLHLLIRLSNCSPLDGPENPQVASATAQDTVQSPPDLGLRRMRGFLEEHLGIHNHAVHAVAALRLSLITARLLKPVRPAHAAPTLYRPHVPVFCIAHRH